MSENLYFIAIAPPDDISAKIRTITKDFATRFKSVKAYQNFPHITLIPPFKHDQAKEQILLHNFAHIRLSTPSFELNLNGFKAFHNKMSPVIYIQPLQIDYIKRLFKELEVFFEYNPHKNFNPHLTVAYRDLTPENFAKAWPEYQSQTFEAAFLVDTVTLYKDINGWQPLHSISLNLNGH